MTQIKIFTLLNMIFRFKKLLFLTLLALCLYNVVQAQQVLKLTSDWQFRKVGDSTWSNAIIPGTVHTDLLNNKQIADPYYRTNEKDLQWIGREDWQYKTTFKVDEALLKSDRLYLVFEGLDTYADVYVQNMENRCKATA